MLFSILCTLAEQVALYLPLVLGAYCAFSLLRIPYLALESAYLFGAICSSRFMLLDCPYLIASFGSCIAALVGGTIAGMVAYGIQYYLRVSFLLSSIITIGLFHGINQFILNGAHVSVHKYSSLLSFLPSVDGYPQLTSLLLFAACILLVFFFFTRSSLGISCGIYGNNPHFFDHYGISGHFIVFAGVVMSSAMAGISGFFAACMNGFADISMAFGINLFCIMALIVGRVLAKGSAVVIPFVGLLVYFIMQQALLKMHFDSRYFTMMQALLVCVLLYVMQRYTKGKNYELGL